MNYKRIMWVNSMGQWMMDGLMDDGAVPKGCAEGCVPARVRVRRCGPTVRSQGYAEGGAALDRDCAEGILQVLTVQP